MAPDGACLTAARRCHWLPGAVTSAGRCGSPWSSGKCSLFLQSRGRPVRAVLGVATTETTRLRELSTPESEMRCLCLFVDFLRGMTGVVCACLTQLGTTFHLFCAVIPSPPFVSHGFLPVLGKWQRFQTLE